tara:strand:- start:23358 stop:23867 length:510 start_codon:yes stop_codon:yes gene_type:complete
MNVLLGISGSVAAKLHRKIVDALQSNGHVIEVVVTKSAEHFIGDHFYYTDEDEWERYEKDSKVLHIELTKWADVLVLAPCTANTLAKISNGVCDNLLTSCVRAWDINKKIVVAPAMNTQMWNSHFTIVHKSTFVNTTGAVFVDPQYKVLYCGDEGIGAMADIDDIIKEV